MNKDAALDLALEALEALHKHGDIAFVVTPEREFRLPQVITAIKQARSAPVQEPAIKQGWDVDTLLDKPAAPLQEPVKLVAYNCKCGRTMKFESVNGVVAAQRQWVGLDDDDISAAYEQMPDYEMYDEFARAIEAKLKEKNNG
jgi:hypothetical protein